MVWAATSVFRPSPCLLPLLAYSQPGSRSPPLQDFLDLRKQPLRPPGTLIAALRNARTPRGEAADVVAAHDGPTKGLLNVGLLFVRATASTLALVRRVENRSAAGWEQAVLNEEVAFPDDLGADANGNTDAHGTTSTPRRARVACCHATLGDGCDLRSWLRPLEAVHNLGHEPQSRGRRERHEGRSSCMVDLAAALPPPKSSTFAWQHHSHRRQVLPPEGQAPPATRSDHVEGRGEKPHVAPGWMSRGAYNDLRARPGLMVGCAAQHNRCQCPPPPAETADDRLRLSNVYRLLRLLHSPGGGGTDRSVRGEYFALGMGRDTVSARRAEPILLRDWMRPFISPRAWQRLLGKPGNRSSRAARGARSVAIAMPSEPRRSVLRTSTTKRPSEA